MAVPLETTMPITFRTELRPSDRAASARWWNRRAFSTRWNSTLPWNWPTNAWQEGPASGYHFVFAELDGRVVGYACYGPIALTVGSYDLYWIAVDKSVQGQGLGRKLMDTVAEIIRGEGGRNIYIETSTKPHYEATPRILRALRLPAGGRARRFLRPGRQQGDILQEGLKLS